MTTGIYLSAMTQDSGKSLIALGLADSLVKRADRVGFFRPIFKGETASDDPMIRLMKEHFNLSDEQVGGAVSLTEALEFIAEGNTEEISARAVSAYHSDVVIVDGIYLTAQNALAVEFDLNAQVSRDLGLPVIAIVGANEASLEEATNAVEVARSELKAAKVDLFSIIVNRADPELRESIEKNVKLGEHKFPVYVLPEIADLGKPTIAEVVSALKLDAVAGRSWP